MPVTYRCPAPRCTNTLPCATHIKQRPSGSGTLYSHRRWRKQRIEFLAEHPWCSHCEQRGLQRIADVVDHIKDHEGDEQLFWSQHNWQPLCKRCHDVKTAKSKRKQYAPVLRPQLTRSAIPVTIVCGPPASGKSYYVEKHKKPGDVVLDLDVIKSKLSGLPHYHAGNDAVLDAALRERNRLLSLLSTESAASRAWLIVGAPTQEERDYWSAGLAGDCIVLDTSAEVCIARIMQDSRRKSRQEEFVGAIRKWWSQYLGGDE